MKGAFVILFVAIINSLGTFSLIIPDELPSILSVIYSNIPTVKKGTDSRIGWGFRLGDRADFQVLVELGPQQYTQPLANQGDDNKNKRNTLNGLTDTLYAQRQEEKKKKTEENEENSKISDSDGGKWLKDWSKNAQNNEENQTVPLKGKPGIAIGEIDAKSVIPDDSELEKQEQIRRLLSELREIQATRKELKFKNDKS